MWMLVVKRNGIGFFWWLIVFYVIGVLIKGDRRVVSGVDLIEFNFDIFYGRNVLRVMY